MCVKCGEVLLLIFVYMYACIYLNSYLFVGMCVCMGAYFSKCLKQFKDKVSWDRNSYPSFSTYLKHVSFEEPFLTAVRYLETPASGPPGHLVL